MLIDRRQSLLLIVDMQERLLPAMNGGAEVARRCAILLESARTLGLPIAASEQYSRGLGHIVPELQQELANAPVFEKLAFSCWRDEGLHVHLRGHREQGRNQVIVAGIEAHVCALQTAIDLEAAGFDVFAVADAMASRAPSSVSVALRRLRHAGIHVVDTEMVVFELLGQAGTPEFKRLSALIR